MHAGEEPPGEERGRVPGPGEPPCPGAPHHHDEAADGKDPENLRLHPRHHRGVHRHYDPEHAVASHAGLEQLPGAARDDRDDRRTDPVEGALDPRQLAVPEIPGRQDQHHDEGGAHEGKSGKRRPRRPVASPAEVDGELCGQGPGRELGERQPFLILGGRDPLPHDDQIALDGGRQRDRSAEAEGPEAEEVSGEIAERDRLGHWNAR